MSLRAFISADMEPGEALKGILTDLRRSGADLKVVRPELLHVTLKFLGDTDEGLVDDIAARMDETLRDIEAFEVRLVGMGAFPSLSNIRVVWVGMEDGQRLVGIAQRLDSALKDLGFERDPKGFKAHLTVARARSPKGMAGVQGVIMERAASDMGSFKVDSIRLKRSVLSPQGPTYHTLKETRLQSVGSAVRVTPP